MTFSDFIRGDEKEVVMMDVMDKAKREQLRTLALAATPGEWRLKVHTGRGPDDFHAKCDDWTIAASDESIVAMEDGIDSHHDVRYIAAANPKTVLALLDRVDELESAAAAVQSAEPGVTVKFDLSPAMVESAIRDRLVELWWTPPNPPPSASDLEARQAKAVALEGRDSLLTGSRNTTAVCHPPSAVPEGLERAAQHIEKKAETYDFEHGSTDPDTGSREYPGDGADYYNNLMELAEEIRLLATTGDSHK